MDNETQASIDEGIGTLLKKQREQKGISREDAAGITRLRLHFIEALEEEDWKELPSPLFIKGFIRSYSQFLGMNPDESIALYEEKNDNTIESPEPLIIPENAGRLKIFLSVIALVVIAATLFFWLRPVSTVNDKTTIDSGIHEEQESTIVVDDPGEASKSQETEEVLEEPQDVQTDAIIVDSDQDTTNIKPEDLDETTPVLPESNQTEEQALTPDKAVSDDSDPIVNNDETLLTLEGIINLRTYIKIYVDSLPAKEYIFTPGSRPQWTAEKGFDIIVGNAAGVEFIFNGKATGVLGSTGKVKRVRYPEDFESNVYEE